MGILGKAGMLVQKVILVMKIQILCSLAAAALLMGCAETRHDMGAAVQNDQNVLTGGPVTGTTLADLPQAVKNTLRQRAPRAEIADIDQTTRDGRVVYEVSFIEQGKNPKLYISEDGQLLPERAGMAQ
jgi:hypothetical protein